MHVILLQSSEVAIAQHVHILTDMCDKAIDM